MGTKGKGGRFNFSEQQVKSWLWSWPKPHDHDHIIQFWNFLLFCLFAMLSIIISYRHTIITPSSSITSSIIPNCNQLFLRWRNSRMFSKSLTSMEMGQYLFRLHIDPYLSFWLHIVFYIYHYLSISVKLGFLVLFGNIYKFLLWWTGDVSGGVGTCGGDGGGSVGTCGVGVKSFFLKWLGFYLVPVWRRGGICWIGSGASPQDASNKWDGKRWKKQNVPFHI